VPHLVVQLWVHEGHGPLSNSKWESAATAIPTSLL
jgi:hypothetical protein